MYLFLAFLLVPVIEIALFIQVGGLIGLWSTLLIVILTAVLGAKLVKAQGQMAMGQMRNSFQTLSDPAEPLAHGAMILFAGALLLTPGFFTDAVGFTLLIPKGRVAIYKFLRKRINVAKFQMGSHGFHTQSGGFRPDTQPQGHDDVIDGDFEDLTPHHDPNTPSKWVDHEK